MRYIKTIIVVGAIMLVNLGYSQDKDLDKKMKKMLNVKNIEWDHYNEDGVFKAQSKKTGKWGMYQYFYDNKRPKTLIPIRYDSLGFYDYSSNYTIVKNKGKYGLLSSAWSGEPSELIVGCIYQKLNYVEGYGGMIMAKGNDMWAYIGTAKGDTLIPFVHKTMKDLPKPSSYFYKYPMKEYPEKLKKIIENPQDITEIDLSRLGLTYLPQELGKCVNAKSVNLEGNKLSRLPDSFFDLQNLEELYLGSNPGLHEFDQRFAKLSNLKVLYIGAINGYGSTSYSRDSYIFSDELSKLQNLKKLSIFGNFNEDGNIPAFIYQLPNLTYLSFDGFFGYEYDKMDLGKLKCRDSLKVLSIETMESFENMNESMKFFPKLEEVYIQTYNHKQTPLWINDLPALHQVKIVYYTPSKTTEGRYIGEEAVSVYGDYYGDNVMTTQDRNKALKQWSDYLKKLEE